MQKLTLSELSKLITDAAKESDINFVLFAQNTKDTHVSFAQAAGQPTLTFLNAAAILRSIMENRITEEEKETLGSIAIRQLHAECDSTTSLH